MAPLLADSRHIFFSPFLSQAHFGNIVGAMHKDLKLSLGAAYLRAHGQCGPGLVSLSVQYPDRLTVQHPSNLTVVEVDAVSVEPIWQKGKRELPGNSVQKNKGERKAGTGAYGSGHSRIQKCWECLDRVNFRRLAHPLGGSKSPSAQRDLFLGKCQGTGSLVPRDQVLRAKKQAPNQEEK